MSIGEASRSPGGRHTAERRWAIVKEVEESHFASVADLSRRLGVSQVSIRHDLEHLHEMGLVRRVHGGAEALTRPGQASLFDARLLHSVETKRAIGQAAASLIRPGELVLLDSGTTVLEIARHIPRPLLEDGGLTIITRSLVIASELRSQRGIRLILLGGIYAHDYDDFVGAQVEGALRGIHANTLFLGTDGVSAERGMTTDNALEAGLYRLLVRCADRVVVVADSSKIGVDKLQVLVSFDEIHAFVADDGAPAGLVDALRGRGVEVILAAKG